MSLIRHAEPGNEAALYVHYFARNRAGLEICTVVTEQMVPRGGSLKIVQRNDVVPGSTRGADPSRLVNPVLSCWTERRGQRAEQSRWRRRRRRCPRAAPCGGLLAWRRILRVMARQAAFLNGHQFGDLASHFRQRLFGRAQPSSGGQ